MLNTAEIIEIIKAVDQSSIQHFELEQASIRLTINKQAATVRQLPEATEAKPESLPARADDLPKREQTVQPAPEQEALQEIVAPMLGTFYAAAEPGGEPLVKVGQTVTAGTVVCVLEAMKLFNEIAAGVDGEIVDVLVSNEEFVEYGQPLFLVKRKP
ncbi:acetyl-CoA carboxylase biotin carboxyl carrier protein|uniref:Biotin carboxyl carrier protein of acetyl-CoA carboxylase n=1 Tax=Dendrosporobacter quercicolus TaxID=146817 RepID=A0A1G9T1C1_9FIRM|nr:acetyl-CoA carboxylase biotin carboxyl carrier protein [Dendrosporobacter quercicolus]NSL48549.1 acetyl-CoA carboxylase biotin carboxyl carrier protein [Dendrosporobacter quercicolus DSM 1736]SDM41543.1 biotin carboxyl carrier protein [Dendrosporobacter quercicolus]